MVSSIGINSSRAELLRQASLVVWEELPMANRAAIECADKLLRNIMNIQRPFGGKCVLGIGDFRQVAPVVKGVGPTALFDASIRSSTLWSNFEVLSLLTPIRNAGDLEYANWVDRIGEGESVQY
jgi:hypothetical protein